MSENEPQPLDPQSPPAADSAAAPAEAQTPQLPPEFIAEPAVVPHRRRYRGLLIGGAAVVALGIGATGVGLGTALAALRADGSSTSQVQGLKGSGSGPNGSNGSNGTGGTGNGYGNFGPQVGRTSVNAAAATSAQEVGVVTIVSTLDYDNTSQAAGTGIILTSGGEILTNNHVVQGSTSIKVTVESTNKTYTAKVVGTDTTDDIAVLQLVDNSGRNVTGLTKATIDTQKLSIGDAVTSVGNAEGTGNLVAAAGSVTALAQDIQVANDTTGATENLAGLIETNADVVSGDSGGPLIDAQGEVTGVVTAASSGSRTTTGYAIPIATALTIAKKIIAGEASSTITIGLPAFLGVQLATAQGATGVTISGALAGSAAAGAGLVAGDIITAVDGTAITSTDSLSAAIKAHAVGDSVTISYTDATGASQQAKVTLAEGPAA
ncbi:MAG: S1C family serine protease [Actinomycetota bacterium]|nr:S1C family serine protease [Actinomycetota bacterium]